MIAIGNGADPSHVPVAERLLQGASPLVRAMAVWALARLIEGGQFEKLRARHLPREIDLAVVAEWSEAVSVT